MDAQSCRERLARCLPDLEIRTCREVHDGWDSFVLDVNDELIARFPKRPDVLVQMEKELELLAAVDEQLPGRVPLPTPACADDPADRFVTYPKLHGTPLSPELVARVDAAALGHEIGAAIFAIHSIDPERAVELGVPAASVADWRAKYDGMWAGVQEHVLPTLTDDDRRATAAHWEGFLGDEDNFSFPPTLIHGDLGAEHVLCDPERSAVTGIIDFGDAALGDPAFDLVGIHADCGPEFTRTVREGYPGDLGPDWERRVAFYSWVIPFNQLLIGIELDDDEILGGARAGVAGAVREVAAL